ncbi:hypothetical protein Pelo_8934 [Pelomyxa schiedti]|nr:hypothetical protein Pelo_8934 [Pelomyxa schiedti]
MLLQRSSVNNSLPLPEPPILHTVMCLSLRTTSHLLLTWMEECRRAAAAPFPTGATCSTAHPFPSTTSKSNSRVPELPSSSTSLSQQQHDESGEYPSLRSSSFLG